MKYKYYDKWGRDVCESNDPDIKFNAEIYPALKGLKCVKEEKVVIEKVVEKVVEKVKEETKKSFNLKGGK